MVDGPPLQYSPLRKHQQFVGKQRRFDRVMGHKHRSRVGGDLSASQVTVGCILDAEAGTCTHYLNDVVWRVNEYRWSSTQPAQYGFDFACGSLVGGLAANFLIPLTTSQWPMKFKIKQVTQWVA